tara:strand:- start:41 stop:436 length:396 start_codon:yes stop_codon:yes gene_type:complete
MSLDDINIHINEINNIENDKHHMLIKVLEVNDDEYYKIMEKLVYYKLVKNIDDIDTGDTIRWISLTKNDNNYVLNRLTVKVIKISDAINNDYNIICMIFGGKIITIKLSENIIFKKLNKDESILLEAINLL